MPYKENPKTKGSGIICCIPQKGTCPNNCEDCFFQSGRSYLEPLSENLPRVKNAAPEFGQHTEEILLEIGYSWEEIDKLHTIEAI